MKQRYIVLRGRKRPSSFDPFGGSMVPMAVPAGGPSFSSFERLTESEPIVEQAELDSNDVARMRGLNDVAGMAPVMPTRLIDPVSRPVSTLGASLTTPTVTWGLNAVGAVACPLRGEGMVPAVLDTGIDATHPAFAGLTIDPQDFTGSGIADVHGHGTHCAATVAGRDVAGRRIGVAPGVRRMIVGKVLGANGGDTAACLKGVQWAAERGATVISMSLAVDFPGYVSQLAASGVPIAVATSKALDGYRATLRLYETLINHLRARSAFGDTTLVVAAAGNENRMAANPDWRVSVSMPAATQGIVSVGAVRRTDHGLLTADFANSGANLVGPGVDVESAWPGGGLVSLSGTSMATPHVAGVALLWAQWLSQRGQLSPLALEAKLLGSAIVTSLAPGYDPVDIGMGLVQAPTTA